MSKTTADKTIKLVKKKNSHVLKIIHHFFEQKRWEEEKGQWVLTKFKGL